MPNVFKYPACHGGVIYFLRFALGATDLVNGKIFFTKGVLGNFMGLEGNEIVQERIPIAELMQKAGNEAKIYQSDRIPGTATGAGK